MGGVEAGRQGYRVRVLMGGSGGREAGKRRWAVKVLSVCVCVPVYVCVCVSLCLCVNVCVYPLVLAGTPVPPIPSLSSLYLNSKP